MFKTLFYTLIWAVAMCAAAHNSNAQIIPGHWHKVLLPQPSRPGGDNTLDFNFVDSLHGISFSDGGMISSTSDGGRSWVLDWNSSARSSAVDDEINHLECDAPHCGILFGNSSSIIVTPAAVSGDGSPNYDEPNLGAYETLAEKMYDTNYGFRLVEYVSTEDEDQFNDSVTLLVTHDKWGSSKVYGNAYIQYPFYGSQEFRTGYIVDSNDVWAAKEIFEGDTLTVIHTTNAGTTWDSTVFFDTLNDITQSFCVDRASKEVFFTQQMGPVDFLFSTDYGSSWRQDSTFGGWYLWRLSNPAPGILWAVISQGGYTRPDDLPPFDVFTRPNQFARKLAYSSDEGKTWLIDSTTFVNDSIEELHFLDARHGWVSTWSDDSLYIWYYDADGSADVTVDHYGPHYVPITAYPNPATNRITISGATAPVIITDMLGRQCPCAVSGNQIDISTLSAGVYFVSNSAQHAIFVKTE